jgi:hypothetical protein
MLLSKLFTDKKPYGQEEISMQLRDLLKDIFTDLQNSCLKCGTTRTCQFGQPNFMSNIAPEPYGIDMMNLMDVTKIEGYSTQLEAICQRIDMIELEMENLKSHHMNVVQSQKVKDTHDKFTMVGHSFILSKSHETSHSLKRGSSTSPDTRKAWKAPYLEEIPAETSI